MLTKVAIPVHLAGQSCEILEIRNLSNKYSFKVNEDGGGHFQLN
jgi:dTDP-4-amino-4,6-dideoxygalactose transaminase